MTCLTCRYDAICGISMNPGACPYYEKQAPAIAPDGGKGMDYTYVCNCCGNRVSGMRNDVYDGADTWSLCNACFALYSLYEAPAAPIVGECYGA